MTEAEYERLLDLIYEAALEPNAWAPVMEAFADAVGGRGEWLSSVNMVDNSAGGITTRIDPAMREPYANYYFDRNPLSNVPDAAKYLRAWRPMIITDDDWMPKEDLLRSEYYNDFLKPQGMYAFMMIRLARRGEEVATLNIARPRAGGRFEAPQRELAARVHPHLIRAFALSEKAVALRVVGEATSDQLERTPHAIFLISGDGAVKHLNGRAHRLVRRGDVQIVTGRLRVGPDSRRLDALIAGALARNPALRGAGSMTVARDGGLPLSLTVAPMRADFLTEMMSGPSALVCVTDLEADITLPERRLRDLFGLTRAEVVVSQALFDGLTTREVAERLGISFFTVRAHLARIYEKTQTRGQADLARLLMRVGGPAEPAEATSH